MREGEGDATRTLGSALGDFAGLDPKAALPLLGLAGSTALGGLKRMATREGVDPAGLVRSLQSEQDEIAAAIPPEVAGKLRDAGILDAGFVRSAPTREPMPVARAPEKRSGGIGRWIPWVLGALLVLWLLTRFMGGPADPVVEQPVAGPETSNPLMVGGMDLGEAARRTLAEVTGALSGITDAESARAALPTLTQANTALADLANQASSLSSSGASALAAVVRESRPAIQEAAQDLLADSAISDVIQEPLAGILSSLTDLVS